MTEARRALILAGGGLRVAAQAGVLQVWMDEAKLKFVHVDSCSGGTLNAALYCQGFTGSEIAQKWREYRPLNVVELDIPGLLRGPFGGSWFRLNRFRTRQLARWNLDWQRIRSFEGSVAFNVYNLTRQRLETISHDEMTSDLLIAGISVPMLFPQVTVRDQAFMDAVFATDANIADAASRDVDELWIVWTISRAGRPRSRWFPGYFSALESAANSRLSTDLMRIEASNEAIRAGSRGEFGRVIDVRMLSMDVEAEYVVEFSRRRIRTAVDLGIQQARAWCAQNDIHLDPASDVDGARLRGRALALTFNETMSGACQFSTSVSAPFARPRRHRIRADLMVRIDDVEEFRADPLHRAHVAGQVVCEALGGALVITSGSAELLALDKAGRTVMRYSLEITDGDGHPLRVDGSKLLLDEGGYDLWRDTTTLPIEVTDQAGGKRVLTGVLRLSPFGLIRLVASIRGDGVRNSIRAANSFLTFFFARLRSIYLDEVKVDG